MNDSTQQPEYYGFFQPVGNCPTDWYGQWNIDRFKAHWLFTPSVDDCPQV
ncbi:hypothetical protein [Rummeliibacillus sp. SL167]